MSGATRALKVRIAVRKRAKTIRVAARGVRVRVKVNRKSKVRIQLRNGTEVVGRKTVKFKKAGTKKVRVDFTTAGKISIAGVKRIPLAVRARATDGAGRKSSLAQKTVRLRG